MKALDQGEAPIIAFRIQPALVGEVDRLAERWGIKRSEALRRLVELGLVAEKSSPPQ